jgi:hypothetical protein
MAAGRRPAKFGSMLRDAELIRQLDQDLVEFAEGRVEIEGREQMAGL